MYHAVPGDPLLWLVGDQGASKDAGLSVQTLGKSPVDWMSWLPCLVLWLNRCTELKPPVSEVLSGCVPGGRLTSQSYSHITEMLKRDPEPVEGDWTLRTMKLGQHEMKGCSSSPFGVEIRISFEFLLEIKG